MTVTRVGNHAAGRPFGKPNRKIPPQSDRAKALVQKDQRPPPGIARDVENFDPPPARHDGMELTSAHTAILQRRDGRQQNVAQAAIRASA
jgi:hypothetical protein